MHANSRFVSSNQSGLHERLHEQLARHAATQYRKPVAPYSRQAFERSIAAWRSAGRLPLILDSGCGVGLSTLQLAACYPGHFVIGVDQSADRLARNVEWPGALPSNCIRVRADLVDFWRLLRQAGIRLDRHYLLYPNPWPKKRHLGRRWHGHPVFPDLLALAGLFECRSNWLVYIEECAAAITQLTGMPVATDEYRPSTDSCSPCSVRPITPFEKKYLASGQTLWRCQVNLATSPSQVVGRPAVPLQA